MRAKRKPEYGIVGAGGVNAGLLGKLPRNAVALGPVGAVSYRVASRIANTLKAGWPVRSLNELGSVRLILFHSPRESLDALADALAAADIRWTGKSLIFCDCDPGPQAARFSILGASVATLRRTALPARLILQGATPALTLATRLARELKVKPAIISQGFETLFDAALTLGSGGLTPAIEGVSRVFRVCGLREIEAAQLAAALFAKTASEYAHSGKQSWQWHIEPPDPARLATQIEALEEPLKGLLKQMLVTGFDILERHETVTTTLLAAAPPDGKAVRR